MSGNHIIAKRKVSNLTELLESLRSVANDLHIRYSMKVDGVFGSFARGEQTDESDVDLLVSFERLPALWEFYGIAEELESHLGRRVHLVHNDDCQFTRQVHAELVPA
jgi:uncharacterized protein